MNEHVKDHIKCGSEIANLGCIKQIPGYIIMRNPDMFYYWLRYDGVAGPITWSRWMARSMAKANKATITC